ncbi:MAG: hypothetical protein Q7R33_06075 [Nitrosarchaeum sp.]|nr:hypothetical protein [Nitrosarchaeum sp.]
MKDLSESEMQAEIGNWMSRLFDKDIYVDDVKRYVETLAQRVAATKMRRQFITKDQLTILFKQVENELGTKPATEANNQ